MGTDLKGSECGLPSYSFRRETEEYHDNPLTIADIRVEISVLQPQKRKQEHYQIYYDTDFQHDVLTLWPTAC